jgi:hypothetical protein
VSLKRPFATVSLAPSLMRVARPSTAASIPKVAVAVSPLELTAIR